MHYRFIVNPVAGRGRAADWVSRIRGRMEQAKASYDVVYSTGAGEVQKLAHQAAADGMEVVVAVGGDGTVNEAANGVAFSSTALAALPAGRGNDYARLLGMPPGPDQALEDLLRAVRGWQDLGQVLDRYFVNIVGAGFDAAVAHAAHHQAPAWLQGTWAYVWGIFRVLFTFRPLAVALRADGQTLSSPRALLVAVGIGSHYGGGMAILPRAVPDDGLLDVLVLENVSVPALLYHLPKVYRGRHLSLPQARTLRCRELALELARPAPLQMDGESMWGQTMHFRLWPRALPVLLGRHAPPPGDRAKPGPAAPAR